ncbi:hypothetical protein GCM10023221_30600 [Luteimicrobium xylanilyticum]|uniref:Uncharacterized protein n=1 Tax=Luteimicrobium xylanilyticum TaxID=1133546 RepID=A0A5P9Q5J3_9MICO|nr:hypothetical protein [Luteimicrobium xylanilyticum]QFU96648.1 hypothetical protein KDY119_00132 [Luteimicrobium xylanilyticum]
MADTYRRLLAILPPGYRREHGDELLDVYLEAAGERRPSALDRLDVARLAARTWGRALFAPSPRDRNRWWAGMVIGVFGLLSFGVGRVVGDAVLAGWLATTDGAVGGVGGWWSTAVFEFAAGPMGWHPDWLVWCLWAGALVIAVCFRRPAWAVLPAVAGVLVAMVSWLAATGHALGGDRRFLVLDAWAPLTGAGWLMLQVVGLIVLVGCVRKGQFVVGRDLRALRAFAAWSGVLGATTGTGMGFVWYLVSHDYAEVLMQIILVTYAVTVATGLVATRTGRLALPYAAPAVLVFAAPRIVLLRVDFSQMSYPHSPPLQHGRFQHFFADLGEAMAIPRHWEATTIAATSILVTALWFFGVRALRTRRAAST